MTAPIPVVLVHGLLMMPWTMKRLGKALSRHGFQPHYFGYRDLKSPIEENAERLANFIKGLNAEGPVHVVGHSLGGLVALRMMSDRPDVAVGRFVALGSPFQGSYIARLCMEIPGLSIFIQQAWGGALDGTGPHTVPDGVEAGVLAGIKGIQHNVIFWRLPTPNDGTVALSETALDGAARYEFQINHNALIWSSRPVPLIANFLKTGAFEKGTFEKGTGASA